MKFLLRVMCWPIGFVGVFLAALWITGDLNTENLITLAVSFVYWMVLGWVMEKQTQADKRDELRIRKALNDYHG